MQSASYLLSSYEHAALQDTVIFCDEWLANLPAASVAANVFQGLRAQAMAGVEIVQAFESAHRASMN